MNPNSDPGRKPRRNVTAIALAVLLVPTVGYFALTAYSARQGQRRAEAALELQVLSTRLGATALAMDYGDPAAALAYAKSAFRGFEEWAVAEGGLPPRFAGLPAVRDEIVAALSREDPAAAETVARLYFELILPASEGVGDRALVDAVREGPGTPFPAAVVKKAEADSLVRAPEGTSPAASGNRGGGR